MEKLFVAEKLYFPLNSNRSAMRLTRYCLSTFFLSSLIILCDFAVARAQDRRSGEDFGGIAFKIAPPVGSFAREFNVGWGVSAMNEYAIAQNWSVSFDITYLRWSAKPNDAIDNYTIIAFTAAPKFYAWDNVYLSLEIGGFYGTTEATRGQRFEEAYQFGVVPVVGYHKGMWDFALEYTFVRNRN